MKIENAKKYGEHFFKLTSGFHKNSVEFDYFIYSLYLYFILSSIIIVWIFLSLHSKRCVIRACQKE